MGHPLGVERCGITDRGVQALAESPHVAGIRDLCLCNRNGIETGVPNEIGDPGAKALAASPNLGALADLDLWNTSVGDAGLEALVESPFLTRLASLTVWWTQVTQEGVDRIKAVEFERWKRESEETLGAVLCWLHTDFDERIIEW